MKAKDIEPGKVYLVQSFSGGEIGHALLPVLVRRVEKSPVRKSRHGWGGYADRGGDTRAYGLRVDPATLFPSHPVEESWPLAKVLRLYDPAEYIAQQDIAMAEERAKRHGGELADRILGWLAERCVTSRYDGSEIRIPRSAFPDLLAALPAKRHDK